MATESPQRVTEDATRERERVAAFLRQHGQPLFAILIESGAVPVDEFVRHMAQQFADALGEPTC